MILAMPSDGLYGDGSGYVPHRDANFEQWIVEEVPQVLQEQFPVVTTESPLFITGLSMGGYGALRLGGKYPQVFQGFSGLSSITQFEQMAQFVSNFAQLQQDALEHDGVLELLLKNRAQLPPFRFDCGSEDILIDANRQLHRDLMEQGIAHLYEEFPGGHEWPYWEQHLEDSLKFFNECIKI
jgi:putative tributyrin esterase